MVTRIGTKRRKTRHKLTKKIREKGKVSVSKYLQEFKAGDKVNLKLNSSIEIGQFFPRFHGLTGTITGNKKGRAYEVKIKDGSKDKLLYVYSIHLNK